MSEVKLSFYPKNSTGRNPGDYEMFIDFDSSAGPSSMVLEAPAGWATIAIKLDQAAITIIWTLVSKTTIDGGDREHFTEFQLLCPLFAKIRYISWLHRSPVISCHCSMN